LELVGDRRAGEERPPGGHLEEDATDAPGAFVKQMNFSETEAELYLSWSSSQVNERKT